MVSVRRPKHTVRWKRKAQRKTRVYYPSYKEGDTRKHTPICPSMQNKHRKDKPESTGSGTCGEEESTGSKHAAGVALLGVSVSLLEPQWYFSYLSHVPQTKPTSYEGLQVGTPAHFLVFLPETPHKQWCSVGTSTSSDQTLVLNTIFSKTKDPGLFGEVQQVLKWHHVVQRCFVMTLMRCCRSSTLVYINSRLVRLTSLHAASLKVQNQIDVKGGLRELHPGQGQGTCRKQEHRSQPEKAPEGPKLKQQEPQNNEDTERYPTE